MDSFDLVNKIGIDEEEIDSKGNRVEPLSLRWTRDWLKTCPSVRIIISLSTVGDTMFLVRYGYG